MIICYSHANSQFVSAFCRRRSSPERPPTLIVASKSITCLLQSCTAVFCCLLHERDTNHSLHICPSWDPDPCSFLVFFFSLSEYFVCNFASLKFWHWEQRILSSVLRHIWAVVICDLWLWVIQIIKIEQLQCALCDASQSFQNCV